MKNKVDIRQEIVDTITDKKTFIKKVKIRIIYRTKWQHVLSSIFLIPKYHVKKIYLTNLWPGTVMKLLGVLIGMKKIHSFDEQEVYKVIKNNIPLFTEFLAIGLHNNESDPPEWLKRAINYHFTPHEILINSIEVYRRLDVQTFFVITESLIDLQSLSHILEAEAPGQSSGTSASTTDGTNEMSNGA
ncbi:hypothetical protein [Sphingobacterium suaedae]|uniref:Uncharacterized protein n=1 Tax=Sphingobacterium suaedae TaxID=1686402 RepID=A0ABW5KFT7_9SPHI